MLQAAAGLHVHTFTWYCHLLGYTQPESLALPTTFQKASRNPSRQPTMALGELGFGPLRAAFFLPFFPFSPFSVPPRGLGINKYYYFWKEELRKKKKEKKEALIADGERTCPISFAFFSLPNDDDLLHPRHGWVPCTLSPCALHYKSTARRNVPKRKLDTFTPLPPQGPKAARPQVDKPAAG